jgi:sugar phosphate isomerase/epimerase
MIGAKELVFHLKTTKLSKEEEDIFEEVVKLAKENDIDLLYESNRTDSAELCLSVLNRFPEINYTLDLGHMNIAAKTGDLGMSIDEFISKIKDRVVYIHAHNNKGKWDEHTALSEGNLDWKHVLDSLDLSKVKKIIIECNKKEEALKCREDLYKYLNRKL